jgi:hypothetical protein
MYLSAVFVLGSLMQTLRERLTAVIQAVFLSIEANGRNLRTQRTYVFDGITTLNISLIQLLVCISVPVVAMLGHY